MEVTCFYFPIIVCKIKVRLCKEKSLKSFDNFIPLSIWKSVLQISNLCTMVQNSGFIALEDCNRSLDQISSWLSLEPDQMAWILVFWMEY